MNAIGDGNLSILVDSATAGGRVKPMPKRAAELERAGPAGYKRIWPKLGLVSAWADGAASGAFAALKKRLPDVPFQAKGLLATEGVVSLPYGGQHPLAICSHAYEFIGDDGSAVCLDELETNGRYEIVLTTAGGLYRYRLGDHVIVESWMGPTPCVRFTGRGDTICDIRGEKLAEPHVAQVLTSVFARHELAARFAVLTIDDRAEAAHYVLLLSSDTNVPLSVAKEVDHGLQQNVHYRLCQRLGQLGPLVVLLVGRATEQAYLEHNRNHKRLGDVKPRYLVPDATLLGQLGLRADQADISCRSVRQPATTTNTQGAIPK